MLKRFDARVLRMGDSVIIVKAIEYTSPLFSVGMEATVVSFHTRTMTIVLRSAGGTYALNVPIDAVRPVE